LSKKYLSPLKNIVPVQPSEVAMTIKYESWSNMVWDHVWLFLFFNTNWMTSSG